MSYLRQKRLSVEELLDWLENTPEQPNEHEHYSADIYEIIHKLFFHRNASVEPLIKLLLHTKKGRTQWAASRALGNIGDKRAIEPLWTLYNTNPSDINVRYEVIFALSKLKDVRLYEIVIGLLNHELLMFRILAITALGNLADQRAVAPLFAQMPLAAFAEKREIMKSLGQIGGALAVSKLETIINGEETGSLKESQYDCLRCDAVRAIREIDDPTALIALDAAIQHSNRGVRRQARRVLAKRLARDE